MLGERLGLGQSNPARAAQRIVTGAVKVDADLVMRIAKITGNSVTLDDLHKTRLAWLKANRPETVLESTK
jgi:hypothetical protein